MTLTKGVARDYKHRGIVANCLVAGGIGTEEAREYLSAADFAAAATPQEFANALVFLASAEGVGHQRRRGRTERAGGGLAG